MGRSWISCSNREHELPLNAEYPAYPYLDIWKMDKQEFTCSFSSGRCLFLYQMVWLKKSNIGNQFKLQFTVKQIISVVSYTSISSVCFVKDQWIDINHCDTLWNMFLVKNALLFVCALTFTFIFNSFSMKKTHWQAIVQVAPHQQISLNPRVFTCMFVCTNCQIVLD